MVGFRRLRTAVRRDTHFDRSRRARRAD
eukprot:SAG31_NODE_31703_length_365_cov_0.774436_1_plen_27_part_10